jgi:hypothetical protein
MDSLATEILAVIKAYPGWAAFVIGLTSFGESLAFVSLLFPGTVILITSGALIAEGVLAPIVPAVAGIVGAVLGDAISRKEIRASPSKNLAVPSASRTPHARHSIFRSLWRSRHFHRPLLRSFACSGAPRGRYDEYANGTFLRGQRFVGDSLGTDAYLLW